MGIVGRVASLKQSCQALVLERDALNEPLGVAPGQVRCDRPESFRAFPVSSGPFQIPSHDGSPRAANMRRACARFRRAHRPSQARTGLYRHLLPETFRRPSHAHARPTRPRPPASALRTYHCGKPEAARAPHMSQKWPSGSTAPPPFRTGPMDRNSPSRVADALHLVREVGPLSCEVEI